MVYVFMIKTLVIFRCEPTGFYLSVRAAQAFIFCWRFTQGLGNFEFWILNWAQAASLRQRGDFPSVRAAQAFIFRHILSCASSPTFLRLSFAHPSLKVRSRFGEFWILNWAQAASLRQRGSILLF